MHFSTSARRDTGSRSLVQLLAYGLVFLQLAQVAEAGKFTNFCKSLICYSSTDTTEKWTPPAYKDVVCKNPAAPKDSKGWNIAKTKGFPTVQDIVKDLELCGIATADDTTMMFYSFNGKYEGSINNAERFQKQYKNLNAKQINDVMPTNWHLALGINNPKAASGNGPEQQAWIARLSQALATVAKGDVYMIAKAPANIYTTPYQNVKFPWYGEHNVWYDYEFGQLQRNNKVTAIYTVDSKTLEIKKDAAHSWKPGSGDKAGNYVNANTVTPESIKKMEDDWKKANPSSCGEDGSANVNAKRGSASSAGSGAAGAACTLKPKSSSTKSGTRTASSHTHVVTAHTTLSTKIVHSAATHSAATHSVSHTKTATRTAKTTAARKTKTASKAATATKHASTSKKAAGNSKKASTASKKKTCPKGKSSC